LQKEVDALLFGNLEKLENAIADEEYNKDVKKIWKTGRLGRYGPFREVQEKLDNGIPLSGLFLKEKTNFLYTLMLVMRATGYTYLLESALVIEDGWEMFKRSGRYMEIRRYPYTAVMMKWSALT
jgi:hypothetical protein